MTNQEREWLLELSPHLSRKELEETHKRLDEYVALVLRIYERIEANPEEYRTVEETLGAPPAS